jgi:hypothetical protein
MPGEEYIRALIEYGTRAEGTSQDVAPGAPFEHHGAAIQLRQAIRAITVDAPDDKPNGPAEAAMLYLSTILNPKLWGPMTPKQRAMLDQVNGAMATLCEALASDTKALRVAAEGFFGGDFQKP